MAASFTAEDRQKALDMIYAMETLSNVELLVNYRIAVENATQGDNVFESTLRFYERELEKRILRP